MPILIDFNTENLLHWFDSNKKDFPWGRNKSPYRVWISEIMLQQTVAASVVPYFERWCSDYPDIQTLATAELNGVLSNWEGLGYYSRCRNIHKAAKILADSYSGILPDTYRELKIIPGIGDYTARAILSIAFKKPYAVLDANVRRIVQRFTGSMDWQKELDNQAIEKLEKIIPHDRPGDFNEAMMQLGQQICTSSTPKCGLCPLSGNCLGFAKGIAEQIPEKKKKKIRTVHKTAFIYFSNGRFLLRKKKKGLFHDLWLIPTESSDSFKDEQILKTGKSHKKAIILKKRNHFYTDNKDILTPCLIVSDEIDLSVMTPVDDDLFSYKWIDVENLNNYPTPSVYRKILNEAKEFL